MKPLDHLAGAGRGRAAPNVRRVRGWLAFVAPWLMIAVVVGRTTPAQLGWPLELVLARRRELAPGLRGAIL